MINKNIIFHSPRLKQYCNLSSSNIKHRGLDFDQCLVFHDHISGICKSTVVVVVRLSVHVHFNMGLSPRDS